MAKPKLVIANGIGYMTSRGDRQFYQYPAIGNDRGLRVFGNERFRGGSALYNITDLRLKLFNWDHTISPMK